MRLYEQSKVLLLAHPFSMSSLDWPRPGDDTNAYDPTLWGSSAPHAPSFHLFVRSNADEFLATLEAVPLLRYPWWPQRLVITEYTREEAVMAHFELRATSVRALHSRSAQPSMFNPHPPLLGRPLFPYPFDILDLLFFSRSSRYWRDVSRIATNISDLAFAIRSSKSSWFSISWAPPRMCLFETRSLM